MDFLGGLIGAGLNFWNASQNRKAQEEANQRNIDFQRETNALLLADKDKDRGLQKEFAQSGVQWRAADALAAGIHPIYALGGSGASYSPSAVSLGSPKVEAETLDLGSMGQDISRAISATGSQTDRDLAFNNQVKKLSLQKMGLENELLGTQIAKQRAQIGPPLPVSRTSDSNPLSGSSTNPIYGPMPPHPFDDPEKTPPLRTVGGDWQTNPNISPMKAWEDRYGDEGPVANLMPWYMLYQDAKINYPRFGGAVDNVYEAIRKADAFGKRIDPVLQHYIATPRRMLDRWRDSIGRRYNFRGNVLERR